MQPIRSKSLSIGNASSPTKSVQFYSTGSPAPNCVSCWNEMNEATGRWEDKGGGWLACPDCCGGQQSCFTCIHCEAVTPPGEPITCNLHGVKSPFLVCDSHKRR